MGVMQCDRTGCGSIMCDTNTSEGYICHECQTEFEEMVRHTPDYVEESVRERFKEFMNSHKGYVDDIDPNDIDWEMM